LKIFPGPLSRILIALVAILSGVTQAQNDSTATLSQSDRRPAASMEANRLEPGQDPENRLLTPFLKHIVSDQKQFWTEPAHFQVKDLKWILPFAGVTGAFIASDSWWARQVPTDHVHISNTISDYGTYALVGLSGASFLLGQVRHDDHLSETGLLSGEATINSLGVAFLISGITQRQRPYQDNGDGHFFAGGSSFPSHHSAVAWSIASVFAHEYPGWFSQVAAYGLATTISMTRVTARQHFPSDVIVGSALGWYFGRQVYRAHHDPELGGSAWGNFIEETEGDKPRDPNYMASPYIPLNSWIYPALERLIALGYVKSAVLGIRPWTRMQCARLLEDAEDKFPNNGAEAGEAGKYYATLRAEFATDLARLDGAANVGARVDSIYTRSMQISGNPLRDGYHFGQTIIDDYGRPYWRGFNQIAGFRADAEAGPVAFYFSGEYQHAPAMPSDPPSVLAAIGAADGTPPLANGSPTINRFQVLDSMASLNINNVQISVGNQSQWMGSGESGPLLLSDNIAPFPAVKIDTVAPQEIPGLSRLLGPLRTEFFIGQLSGQHWETCTTCPSYPGYPNIVGPNIVPQPLIHGEKISFQPTPNLEFGMGVTAMFGGPGQPITFGTFFHTYYIHTPNLAQNPGKRVSEADFAYRIPGIRDWLTLYFDSMTWDEFSPIGSSRANVNPGIYMPKLPMLSKLQLRAEGFNISRTTEFVPGFVYYNGDRFRSGYTNDGNLLASWIGRAGRGGQGWLTYSWSARSNLQLGYRLQTVSPDFMELNGPYTNSPGGGRLADYAVKTEFMVGPQLAVSGLLQYEQWTFPVLNLNRQTNVSAGLQLTFYPNWRIPRQSALR
jgi:Capsule assembly protein Wzi/PAP2 superfamily